MGNQNQNIWVRVKGIRNWKYWCSRVGSGLAMWEEMAEKQYRVVGGQDRKTGCFGGRYRINTINDYRMKGFETIIRRGVRLAS